MPYTIMANSTDVSKTASTSALVVPSSIGAKMPRKGAMTRSRLRYAHCVNPAVGLAPNRSRKNPMTRMISATMTKK